VGGEAGRRWTETLAAWAIPEHILHQATEDPWALTSDLFPRPDPSQPPPDTRSRRKALEALAPGATVLDVGVGAGAASLSLVPPASRVIGVDERANMLASFAAAATKAGIDHAAVEGRWPDVAGEVEPGDVVVCHHVLYNVPDLADFARALTGHARTRVVVELTDRHPLVASSHLWRHFWGIDRPDGPTAEDAVAVLAEVGIDAEMEREERPARRAVRHADWVAFLTRRLCLPPSRRADVEAALAAKPEPATRQIVTLWWRGEAS
jgi:hypothetical protein